MAKNLKIEIGIDDIPGSRAKEVETWLEPYQCGDNTSMLKVTCTVDCEKCTFKVSSSFTTKQFHNNSQEVRVDMLQKKAALEYAAGLWGFERCQFWSEQQGDEDPNQIGMFPGQEDEE